MNRVEYYSSLIGVEVCQFDPSIQEIDIENRGLGASANNLPVLTSFRRDLPHKFGSQSSYEHSAALQGSSSSPR